ncbi:MAG: hypothetical protein Q8941_22590 [Bacteroidota bacterium]|nr:hypothetical protein [Bacteroidota bacterium]
MRSAPLPAIHFNGSISVYRIAKPLKEAGLLMALFMQYMAMRE